jgi:hypothetical protein
MASITLAEVKKILRITSTYVNREEINFTSRAYSRLANKPATLVGLYKSTVDATGTSSWSSTQYYSTLRWDGYLKIRMSTVSGNTTAWADYSYNEYDELITYLIPIVERDVCEYLNNYFEDKQTRYQSGFDFIPKGTSNAYIFDSDSKFSSYGFTSTMDFIVEGSRRNCGLYHASNLSNSKMYIGSTEDFTSEKSSYANYASASVRLTRVRWPEAMKVYIAQIIWFNINRSKDYMIASKSIGPTSVSYESLGAKGYPQSLYSGLNKWRNHVVK